MKKLIIVALVSFSITSQAQSIKYISDPYIVNQSKRDVFHSWAKFTPEQRYKKVLGIKIKVPTPEFELAWAAWAPSQNRRYRRGADIRPLSSKGDLTKLLGTTAADIGVNTIYDDNLEEIGQSSTDVIAAHAPINGVIPDIFWTIFYKKYLNELKNYSDIQSYIYKNMQGASYQEYKNWQALLSNQLFLDEVQTELEIFKERTNTALGSIMERGDRILNLHSIYLDYSSWKEKLQGELTFLTSLDFKFEQKKKLDERKKTAFEASTERELMRKVVLDAKINYHYKE